MAAPLALVLTATIAAGACSDPLSRCERDLASAGLVWRGRAERTLVDLRTCEAKRSVTSDAGPNWPLIIGVGAGGIVLGVVLGIVLGSNVTVVK